MSTLSIAPSTAHRMKQLLAAGNLSGKRQLSWGLRRVSVGPFHLGQAAAQRRRISGNPGNTGLNALTERPRETVERSPARNQGGSDTIPNIATSERQQRGHAKGGGNSASLLRRFTIVPPAARPRREAKGMRSPPTSRRSLPVFNSFTALITVVLKSCGDEF
jgi:hypothetical protein